MSKLVKSPRFRPCPAPDKALFIADLKLLCAKHYVSLQADVDEFGHSAIVVLDDVGEVIAALEHIDRHVAEEVEDD